MRVLGLLFAIFLLTLLVVVQPGASGPVESRRPAELKFVLRAEKNYLQKQRAFRYARSALDLIRQTEAAGKRRARAEQRQWIEPAWLWRQKLAAERNLPAAQQRAREAFRKLDHARDVARRMQIGKSVQREHYSRVWAPKQRINHGMRLMARPIEASQPQPPKPSPRLALR